MTREDAITVEGLRVVRQGRLVLPDLSIGIAAGHVTGLLGPSGSGKSTLMRAIVGVQRVAAGAITILGLPAGTPELRPRVGYVTQAPSVYGDITVGENLRYFARVLGVPHERTRTVLATVELERYRDQVVNRLSGGERARVSLATALLGEPDVLVLDEPTVGLDPVLRRELWGMFRELAAAGTTLLVSSHVMDEAERCDELVLLREGSVLAAEPPDSLRARTGAADLDDAFLRLIDEADTQ